MTHDIRRRAASVFRGAVVPPAVAFSLVALFLAAGCGDDDDGSGDSGDSGDPGDSGDDGADGDAAPAPDGSTSRATGYVANPVGSIELIEGYVGERGTGAAALLRDAPDAPPAELLASEGPCEVWTHALEPAECDPPCELAYCVADDQCAPFPLPVSAGEIAVAGLTEELRFVPGGLGYDVDPELLPEDLFADGAAIEVTAAGDAAPGFSLAAVGVGPLDADLDLEFDVTLVIEDGVDEVIGWTAGGVAGARVQLALQVGHHGAPYEALLVCEADDADGELVVPGSLIQRFPRQSNGLEQHASWIARFSRDVADGADGPIELMVASRTIIPQLDHR